MCHSAVPCVVDKLCCKTGQKREQQEEEETYDRLCPPMVRRLASGKSGLVVRGAQAVDNAEGYRLQITTTTVRILSCTFQALLETLSASRNSISLYLNREHIVAGSANWIEAR